MKSGAAKFVRRELLKMFRKYLPEGVHIVQKRLAGNGVSSTGEWHKWEAWLPIDKLRAGVELAEAMPDAGRGKAPSRLERYEAELRAWKRRRTIARTKAAKYARLVRYHRKLAEQEAKA
jgi:hypothetical protein